MIRVDTIYGGLRFPYSCFCISRKQSDGKYAVYVVYDDGSIDWDLVFSGTLAECRRYLKFMFKHYVELE